MNFNDRTLDQEGWEVRFALSGRKERDQKDSDKLLVDSVLFLLAP